MEPFKNHIDAAAVTTIADRVRGSWDRDTFLKCRDALGPLELKARVIHLADALRDCLPADFPTALKQLTEGLDPGPEHTDELTGSWDVWPLCTFVERHGLEHPELSLDAMERLTPHWSCEFAVRPFFAQDPETVIARVEGWATHRSVHLRRLASEGTRSRLPWGIRLQHRIEHPDRLLPTLELLRDDPSEYVRRSVANHLNDLSKDHPERMLELAEAWLIGADRNRRRLVKHGLRTLIKAGESRAYALIGLLPFEGSVRVERSPAELSVGEVVQLRVVLESGRKQRVRLDLGVHHRRKNGTLSPKVFHWTERTLEHGEVLEMVKDHRVKKVTTRKLYAGEQAIDLRVNGVATEPMPFFLRV